MKRNYDCGTHTETEPALQRKSAQPSSFADMFSDVNVNAVGFANFHPQHKTHAAKPKPQPIAIIPATGWVFNDKGQVILTAYDPTNIGSQRSWFEPASCNQR